MQIVVFFDGASAPAEEGGVAPITFQTTSSALRAKDEAWFGIEPVDEIVVFATPGAHVMHGAALLAELGDHIDAPARLVMLPASLRDEGASAWLTSLDEVLDTHVWTNLSGASDEVAFCACDYLESTRGARQMIELSDRERAGGWCDAARLDARLFVLHWLTLNGRARAFAELARAWVHMLGAALLLRVGVPMTEAQADALFSTLGTGDDPLLDASLTDAFGEALTEVYDVVRADLSTPSAEEASAEILRTEHLSSLLPLYEKLVTLRAQLDAISSLRLPGLREGTTLIAGLGMDPEPLFAAIMHVRPGLVLVLSSDEAADGIDDVYEASKAEGIWPHIHIEEIDDLDAGFAQARRVAQGLGAYATSRAVFCKSGGTPALDHGLDHLQKTFARHPWRTVEIGVVRGLSGEGPGHFTRGEWVVIDPEGAFAEEE